jgi:hypothetical protein
MSETPNNVIASLDHRDNLHIRPIRDWAPHALTTNCTCEPQLEIVNGVRLIFHHAFDQREMWERERPNRDQ